MLKTVTARHVIAVGVVIAAMVLLTGFGVIGAGDESLLRPEHFDAKQVTVWPAGGDGVRIREVVDIDFGLNARHGYKRIVPNDFGAAVDVVAASPDANADLDVVVGSRDTTIRVGSPYETFTARRRYVLEYTLPDARLSGGELWLDIIGTDETFETELFEVVVTGFDFDRIECDTGTVATIGGCEFVRDSNGRQVAVIAPLRPGRGITIGGAFSATSAPALPEMPPKPAAVRTGFRLFGLLMIPLGVAAAAVVYTIARRIGANTVIAGGAADAAFGDLPRPSAGPVEVSTIRVADSRLADLATVEFSPPRGLAPWHASALLRERIDDDTVIAWFSEMIAREAIVIEGSGKNVTLRRGPRVEGLVAADRAHLAKLFGTDDSISLGTYDPVFTTAWSGIRQEQAAFAKGSGWWSSGGPGARSPMRLRVVAVVLAVLMVGVAGGLVGAAESVGRWRWLASPWMAMVAGVVVPLLATLAATRRMFASRSASGSALTLRAESFRRFLAASEGRHVDWAWSQGLLREYSAWAVALGAADAWARAIEASNIPDRAEAVSGPLLLHTSAPTLHSTHTAPSSSGGGGSFGGGGVGGGGGGGSSGSW